LHELVGRLFLIMENAPDVELQCRCMEAMNALHDNRADRMQPYYTRFIPIAASAFVNWESVVDDDPTLAVDLVTAALELGRLMLMELPESQAGRCLEIATKGLTVVPQLPRLSTACRVEASDLVNFMLSAYPEPTAAFL
jgi:hypothetical protein